MPLAPGPFSTGISVKYGEDLLYCIERNWTDTRSNGVECCIDMDSIHQHGRKFLCELLLHIPAKVHTRR
jgi:hypothetical protein